MSSKSLEKLDIVHHDNIHDDIPGSEYTPGDVDIAHSRHKSPQEKALVLKQDLIIIPMMTLMYFFGYMDRTQIGNARIMGMEKSLGLKGSQFYNCLMIFFVGFMVIELPAILLLRIVPAQRVYGGAVILFGLAATLISACEGYAGLMVLRFILGAGESVVTSGFLYLSFWYKRDELAVRSGLFFVSSAVAGLVSGVVSWAVAKNLEGDLGRHAWQWLFIVEGVPTIALGLIVFFFLPGLPDQVVKNGAFGLRNPGERDLVRRRLAATQNQAGSSVSSAQIWAAFRDGKTWVGALLIAGIAIANTAFVIFIPTFIKEFGLSALDTQLYSMIPYAFAIVFTLLMCNVSDRFDTKAAPLFVCQIVAIAGLVILLTATNTVALMAGCCFVAAGATPAVPISASWLTTIHGGYTKKGTMFAINQVFIQCYGIIATQIYDTPPRFLKGHGITLGLLGLSTLCTICLYVHLRTENKKRDAFAMEFAAKGEVNPLSARSFEELYDFHPDFRYAL